jgi:hypothetical protein
MKLALVTIVTTNLEQMRTFYQAVLQIEPQIYRGNYIEFTLEAGTLALWRQSQYRKSHPVPVGGSMDHCCRS